MEVGPESLHYLLRHALLHLQAPGIGLHHAYELAEAHGAALTREVADGGMPFEGGEVVLAGAHEGDALEDDGHGGQIAWQGLQLGGEVHAVTRQSFCPEFRYSRGSVPELRGAWILAKSTQQRTDGSLGCGAIKGGDGRFGHGSASLRFLSPRSGQQVQA